MSDYEQGSSYGEPPAKRPAPAQGGAMSMRGAAPAPTDANVTLWQFLLDLLLKQQYSHIICWTNNEGEFKLLDAEQVAKLWGLKKNKHNMNYDKLSRALRYYYDKNIIKKVMGQKFVYKFVSFPEMVKTENRIPFKKKMESIVNDGNPTSATSSSSIGGFQTMRPYDVKSGLIQQVQQAHLAAAAVAQQQLIQHQQAALVEQKYQIPAEHHALYHNSLPAASPAQLSKISSEPSSAEDRSLSSPISRSPAPSVASHTTAATADLTRRRPSPAVTPTSVCTPAGSPSPAPVFDLPVSDTPTPPPKPATPLRVCEPEVKVKLEIPELDDHNCQQNLDKDQVKKQAKLSRKPNPLSINNYNDVQVNMSSTSPLINRTMLPSLNTPMFLTSPLFGQRTPLIPGLHFWGAGTLSPVATLSPRLASGLPPGAPAFTFPTFAVSPATLASFNSFADNVFTSSASSTSSSTNAKIAS